MCWPCSSKSFLSPLTLWGLRWCNYIQACSYIQTCLTQLCFTQRLITHTHTYAFIYRRYTHKHFLHTETLLHIKPFSTQRFFDTRTPLHINRFIHSFLHNLLLHTNTFTHKRLYTNASTHIDFYTPTLLHTNPFTHRRFHTQTL